jgi:hypothetical protein
MLKGAPRPTAWCFSDDIHDNSTTGLKIHPLYHAEQVPATCCKPSYSEEGSSVPITGRRGLGEHVVDIRQ